MWWPPALDALVVVLFVVIGRESHEEGNALAAILETAAPFLIGLALGWALVARRHAPQSSGTGLAVVASTLVVGMLGRRIVFDDGTAISFVVVATLFLSAGMLGWRLVSRRLSAQAD